MNGIFLISALATRAHLDDVHSVVIHRIAHHLGVPAKKSTIGDELSLPFEYRKESGQDLTSQVFVFGGLHSLQELSSLKQLTMKLESDYSVRGKRIFNINPGFLDRQFLLMASHKDATHRSQLCGRFWVEPQLRWSSDRLVPYPWTFEEFEPEERRQFIAFSFFEHTRIGYPPDRKSLKRVMQCPPSKHRLRRA